jgi:hypothetical protein
VVTCLDGYRLARQGAPATLDVGHQLAHCREPGVLGASLAPPRRFCTEVRASRVFALILLDLMMAIYRPRIGLKGW